MVQRDKQNFLQNVQNGAIVASSKAFVNLASVYNEFGRSFNTLNVLNTSGSNVKIYLDSREVGVVGANGGTMGFDHEANLNYSNIELEELDGAAVGADTLFFSVGRLGKNGV